MKNGELVKIEPQLYSLLWLFIENPGVTVSRNTIEQIVWDGRPVTDEALRAAMKKLRDLLDDDARSPRFIKTIPKQGYKWLAKVSHEFEESDLRSPVTFKKNLSLYAVLAVSLVIAVLLFNFYLTDSDQPDLDVNKSPKIIRLTELTGSEVDANYHAERGKLAFIHRDTRNSPQQLYVKSLSNNVVKRLSWDQANYSDSYWSADGTKLAFMRLLAQQTSFHVADFNENGSVTHLETLDSPALKDKFVIGWLHGDKGLLLAETMRPNKQHRIYAFDMATKTLQPLTNPNVAGRGDFLAALSPNGEMLAILREEVSQESSLLVTSLSTGNLIAKSTLPFVPSRLIWTPDSNTIAMSNFYGEHGRYSVASLQYSNTPLLPEHSLDLFSACGEQCYILRQHNGNFLDLQETPLVSLQSKNQPKKNVPILDGGRLLRRANAQDFPQYLTNNAGMLLVSLQGKEVLFQQLTNQNQLRDIATLNNISQLTSVSSSPDNELLIGASGGRLFTASFNAAENKPVTFITPALERFTNPVWNIDSRHVYVARMTANRPDIFALDVITQQMLPVVDNLLAFSPRSNKANEAIGIRPDLSVVRLTNQNEQWQQVDSLGKVTSASPNRWRLTNEAFYYTKYQIPEAFLCKIDLAQKISTHREICWSIGDNRFRLNFDINVDTNKVMLVESLSAESDIVQLTW
ncbi:winged helix-turn-helix domain-containing protein [Thalassotalea aquiviva]|uniref:winged helix-turn-helix domain-containing protein n=1 Tax=Thalassotalea aquiviva TaxID=3242415 RepID=UPI00352B6D26